MKAMVHRGAGSKAWKEVPDPVIVDPTAVIARVDTTTICGTDLHTLEGDVDELGGQVVIESTGFFNATAQPRRTASQVATAMTPKESA